MPHIASQPPFNDLDLTHEEKSHLNTLLTHKLRNMPTHHIPTLSLSDIIHTTPRTHFPNIPRDINLMFLLRQRAAIDHYASTPLKAEQGQDADITRAIWFYRLDRVRQFQRYHDAVRWNVAIYAALLTASTLTPIAHSPKKDTAVTLTPSRTRFIHFYLAAVLEHHNSASCFTAREAFIALWRESRLELFTIYKSWAKKAMQRVMKQRSREWEAEIDKTRTEEGREDVERLVGSLVPGRREWGVTREEKMEVKGGEDAEELLGALRVPCPIPEVIGDGDGAVQKQKQEVEEEGVMVCDLRTAISCVQEMTPREMLPVLMRLFPMDDGEV
ncbi:hypothetical protein N0V94_004504 [Neodidymelliopsis sp. IMI 364377]|nr:hypothetical protein N0V94_004504 [Neodidymelliopsis sp. IMI 364377]